MCGQKVVDAHNEPTHKKKLRLIEAVAMVEQWRGYYTEILFPFKKKTNSRTELNCLFDHEIEAYSTILATPSKVGSTHSALFAVIAHIPIHILQSIDIPGQKFQHQCWRIDIDVDIAYQRLVYLVHSANNRNYDFEPNEFGLKNLPGQIHGTKKIYSAVLFAINYRNKRSKNRNENAYIK